MKQLIPAVFFQKRANGPTAPSQLPARLELFENELAAVTGGFPRMDSHSALITASATSATYDPCGSP